ncbi:hypothetical protein ACIQAC_36170 [Streptomyces sp. NPDC088387]|uniref:hypothetical protein n=1 Tax=Streptomyces sp. NPDC088387 TaxID=3365859 RepID=UPI00380CE67E
MSRYHPLHGIPRPRAEQVNAPIRRLMSQPATRRRTVAYEQLLVERAEATRDDVETAA